MRKNVRRMKKLIMVAMFVVLAGCGRVEENSEPAETNMAKEVIRAENADSPQEEEIPEASDLLQNKLNYAGELTKTERASIEWGKLSSDHMYYREVVTKDAQCAEYIEELCIYDEEIADTFVVHVSLPPAYDENKVYPMVVMTDGVWRLSDHPELRPLMTNGEIEDVILVSVGYPNDYEYEQIRERDLVKEAESYLHFIVDNLVPYLSEVYSVDSSNLTLTGHSLGGYFGFFALFNSDTIGKNLFRNYYIGSPSMQAYTGFYDAYDYEEAYFSRKSNLDSNVYVTVGSEESQGFCMSIEMFIKTIQERSYSGLSLEYEVIEGYDHNTVFKPSIKNTLLKYYGKQ